MNLRRGEPLRRCRCSLRPSEICARRGGIKAEDGILCGSMVFESTGVPDEGLSSRQPTDAALACAAGLDPETSVRECETWVARGWIWGLHLRTDGHQGRLITCPSGAVVDVAVDLRPSSPTYRLWMSLLLDDVTRRTVWLPAGLAHGFQALTETARVSCWMDRAPGLQIEATVRHDDPDLDIPWPLPVSGLAGLDVAAPELALVEPELGQLFGKLVTHSSAVVHDAERRR